MWAKERFEADAAKVLGEAVTASVYMLPYGALSKSVLDGFFQSLNAAFPIAPAVGVGLTLLQGAGDKALDRSTRGTPTIQSTSKLYFFKDLYMAATPTRLAAFQVKPGLFRNTLGALSAIMPLHDLRDFQIDKGLGPFRRVVITAQSGATLTFKVHPSLVKEANRVRDAVVGSAIRATPPSRQG